MGEVFCSFFEHLLMFFHYSSRSSGALLAGTLPLRYCSFRFASRTPFVVLPVPGHVSGLVTVQDQAAVVGGAERCQSCVWISKKTISD